MTRTTPQDPSNDGICAVVSAIRAGTRVVVALDCAVSHARSVGPIPGQFERAFQPSPPVPKQAAAVVPPAMRRSSEAFGVAYRCAGRCATRRRVLPLDSAPVFGEHAPRPDVERSAPPARRCPVMPSASNAHAPYSAPTSVRNKDPRPFPMADDRCDRHGGTKAWTRVDRDRANWKADLAVGSRQTEHTTLHSAQRPPARGLAR
jgi:hypothetical protein